MMHDAARCKMHNGLAARNSRVDLQTAADRLTSFAGREGVSEKLRKSSQKSVLGLQTTLTDVWKKGISRFSVIFRLDLTSFWKKWCCKQGT